MIPTQWTQRAVKAVERAFFEIVESDRCDFYVAFGEGALGELAAIQDHEVPPHSRMDLLIAQHATMRESQVMRAVARLFASSQLPERLQAPNGRDPYVKGSDDGPTNIFEYLAEQGAAGTLLRPSDEVEVELREHTSRLLDIPMSSHLHLTEHTLTSMHVRTVRAHAQKLRDSETVRECDEVLQGPVHPLHRALLVRRRLAGFYNAHFHKGLLSLGYWTVEALDLMERAFRLCFVDPDDPLDLGRARLPPADALVQAQALLRDLGPENVHDDALAELDRVKNATCYDLQSLRAMGRLYYEALHWQVRQLRSEIGRPVADAS